jgi:hypothetical protein
MNGRTAAARIESVQDDQTGVVDNAVGVREGEREMRLQLAARTVRLQRHPARAG